MKNFLTNTAHAAGEVRPVEPQGVTNSAQQPTSAGKGNGAWDSFMEKTNDVLLLIYSAVGVFIFGKFVFQLFNKKENES